MWVGSSGCPRRCSCSGLGRSSEGCGRASGKCDPGFRSCSSQALPGNQPPPAPCWAPGLIQLSEQTAVHPLTQHSQRVAGPGQHLPLWAVWPGWGLEEGGGARGNPGSWGWRPGRCIGVWGDGDGWTLHSPWGDRGSSSADGFPPPTAVAVAKALGPAACAPRCCGTAASALPPSLGDCDTLIIVCTAQPHVARRKPQLSQGLLFLSPCCCTAAGPAVAARRR